MKKKILCGLFILCTLLIGCDSDIEQRVLEDNIVETESTEIGWNQDEEDDLSEDFSESEDELMDFRLVDGNLYDKVKQNFEYESYDTITLYKFNDNWFAQVTNVGGILPEHFDDYDNWEVMQYYDISSRYEIPSVDVKTVTSQKAGEVYYSHPNRIILFYGDGEVTGDYTKIGEIEAADDLKKAVVNNPILRGWGNKIVQIKSVK